MNHTATVITLFSESEGLPLKADHETSIINIQGGPFPRNALKRRQQWRGIFTSNRSKSCSSDSNNNWTDSEISGKIQCTAIKKRAAPVLHGHASMQLSSSVGDGHSIKRDSTLRPRRSKRAHCPGLNSTCTRTSVLDLLSAKHKYPQSPGNEDLWVHIPWTGTNIMSIPQRTDSQWLQQTGSLQYNI